MNDAEGFESQAVGLRQILFDNSLYVTGWNAVKIENVRHWYADGLGKGITKGIERHGGGP